MKARVALMRSWSILHPHSDAADKVKGDYHIICHEDESDGWLRRSIDMIEAEIGTVVEVLEVRRDGFQSRTEYKLTRMGLEKIERTLSQDPDHLK